MYTHIAVVLRTVERSCCVVRLESDNTLPPPRLWVALCKKVISVQLCIAQIYRLPCLCGNSGPQKRFINGLVTAQCRFKNDRSVIYTFSWIYSSIVGGFMASGQGGMLWSTTSARASVHGNSRVRPLCNPGFTPLN